LKPGKLARTITAGLCLASTLYASEDEQSVAPNFTSNFASSIPSEPDSVQWRSLLQQSFFFLAVEHAFRVATDPDTRQHLGGSFFKGYANSVGNLHGWSDGDPFQVNYIGHPIQGAISGDIWIHNDPRYRNAEFGRSKRYWVSRLRATTFAFAYSEQFEIGPISEASIGHVQSYYHQQGFADHVITPVAGGILMVAEDAVDRYVILAIERHTRNRWVRIAARGFLNPSRSFANCMEHELPWHRDTRPDGIDRFMAPGQ
jgi:hypothetical protein